jgi:hypothetical protein
MYEQRTVICLERLLRKINRVNVRRDVGIGGSDSQKGGGGVGLVHE